MYHNVPICIIQWYLQVVVERGAIEKYLILIYNLFFKLAIENFFFKLNDL